MKWPMSMPVCDNAMYGGAAWPQPGLAAVPLHLSASGDSYSLTFVGLYGAIASEKLYQRFHWHDEQAWELSGELEALVPGLDLKQLIARGRNRHRERYKYNCSISHHEVPVIRAGLGLAARLIAAVSDPSLR